MVGSATEAFDGIEDVVGVKVVRDTTVATLQSFVRDHAGETAVIHTDEHGTYRVRRVIGRSTTASASA